MHSPDRHESYRFCFLTMPRVLMTAGRHSRRLDPLRLVLRAGLGLVNCAGSSQSGILRIGMTVATLHISFFGSICLADVAF
ncbi:hypothetical protein BD310DRAFT_920736 [Dichomitus squalens]|uniref:Uncharacterized protein n=1 Tax=Dichomitus squalens TaxID=114155 RepID=A0A4Q9Q2F5_9APHY|nr:hypothetical protein BD310DRAFT_920736 [Dichomitus squalens]